MFENYKRRRNQKQLGEECAKKKILDKDFDHLSPKQKEEYVKIYGRIRMLKEEYAQLANKEKKSKQTPPEQPPQKQIINDNSKHNNIFKADIDIDKSKNSSFASNVNVKKASDKKPGKKK